MPDHGPSLVTTSFTVVEAARSASPETKKRSAIKERKGKGSRSRSRSRGKKLKFSKDKKRRKRNNIGIAVALDPSQFCNALLSH
jgi:hypothetical protein